MKPTLSGLSPLYAAAILSFSLLAPHTWAGPIPGWQPEIREESYLSGADGSMQPTLFYDPAGGKPAPLLVALHTWGGNYKQPEPGYAAWCIQKGWVFAHPDFRGPNRTPQACGSELVIEDIRSLVAWAQQKAQVDPRRIYLIGCSGGGYAAMLLAGRMPDLWAGVSQWCGIFDLRQWHAKHKGATYGKMLESACGGAPGSSPEVDEEFRKRSASHWFAGAVNVPMDLNTGILDGHKGSVPIDHSLNAFNALANPADRIAEADIESMTRTATVPAALQFSGNDPLYSDRAVLFRKVSAQTRITVFQGGHESVLGAGLAWLEKQVQGTPAVWKIEGKTNPGSVTEVAK